MAPTTGFVLDIPPDPSWEPIEQTDTLAKDGYYACKVKSEKIQNREKEGKSAQVILTLEIADKDEAGKHIAKFLPDPRTTTKETWWLWRSLLRSIYGTNEAGKNGLRYTLGQFTGAWVYVRTEAYGDEGRTSVGAFVTGAEYKEAEVAGGEKFRWVSKPKAGGVGAVGALPVGLPSSFPGAGSAGLPGTAAPPTGFPPAGSAPQPGNAPMQSAQSAPASPFAIPPGVAPVTITAPASPFGAAPGAGSPFAAAPASPFGAPPPPANGAAPSAPQPGVGGFAGFPLGPGGA